MTDTSEEFFENCFSEPLALLREMPEGKGAVVALATSLFLYERYWSILPRDERESTRPRQLAKDFHSTEDDAKVFWDMFRNGLLHLGVPMQRKRGQPLNPYSMQPDAEHPFLVDRSDPDEKLIVNPWLFCDRVLELWTNRMEAFDTNSGAPAPKRYRVETHYFTDSPGQVEHHLVEEA